MFGRIFFFYFGQFSKHSFNKSIDLSRILGLFWEVSAFDRSLNMGNTVNLTGLTYTFTLESISRYIGQQWSKKLIMGRSSVVKMDK